MIIKKLTIENIRSYEYEEISFSLGSTLLAGDIGSGKTTILLAIEFGLFGLQPGQRGSALLRNGKEEGRVVLEFQVDDNQIIVERSLKRGKTISQDYAAITINGEKQELAVTEIKQRILNLLNYPSEFSKKQNTLYKFTVYTPQEEMKQIILEDPETRVNTLRHVFGIDKYRTILENILILRLKLREEKRLMEGIISNLDQDQNLLEQKEKNIQEKKNNLFELESDLLLKIEKRKEKEKEKQEVTKLIEGKAELKEKLGQTNGALHSKTEIFTNNERTKDSLKKEIQEFQLLNFNPLEFQEIEDKILINKKQMQKLSELNLEINSQIATTISKISECEDLGKKMQNLEVCPTCRQDVDAVYRANVLNKNHNELSQSKNKIQDLEIERKNMYDKIKELDVSTNFLEKKLTDLKILKMKSDTIEEKKSKVTEIERQNSSFESDIHLLKNQIETIKSELLFLTKYDLIFEDKSRELTLLLREERISDIKLAESKKEIEMLEKSISELQET